MSTKITNNLKVHGESTAQKYTDAQYNTDTQRINGAQPGTPISSKLINTGLRNATLVTSALIDALKTIVPNDNDLTTAITVGTATTHEALVTALTEALVKIKVENATLADNVKSGAIVKETTTARESKQGFGISLGLNSKLQFKTTWLGTHKNNDVLYYSVAGALKGFYIVKGLSVETAEQTAGTLTITAGQTPTTHAANLQRLTFETAISVDAGLSKTDTINSSSTANQLATAKGVYDYTQAKLAKHTTAGIKILTRGTTDGVLSDLDKATSISSASTNSQIPSAKAVFDIVDTKVTKIANYGLSKNDFTDALKNKLNEAVRKDEADAAYFKRDVVSSTESYTESISSSTSIVLPLSNKSMYVVVITLGYGGSNNLETSYSFSVMFHGVALRPPSGYNSSDVIIHGVFSSCTFTARVFASNASTLTVSDLRFTGEHSCTHFKFALHRIA